MTYQKFATFTHTLMFLLAFPVAASDPTVAQTTVLGPFTGVQATLHPDNISPYPIAYYGTDLGFTYQHQDRLQLLFGDTMANPIGDPIEASTGRKFEDSFGSISMVDWPDPATFAPGNIPLIKLGQNPGSTEMAAINPGHAMEGFKTPVGGFSNGSREFGIFFTFKPQGCSTDADCDRGLQCDQGLGFIGPPWNIDEGVTFGCADGSSEVCIADTMADASGAAVAGSGFCIDRGSSVWSDSTIGRTNAMSVKLLVGTRSLENPKIYATDHEWRTNRFLNVALRTVNNFDPIETADTASQDYRPANSSGKQPRVFLWGRPGFIGVKSVGRDLALYFAYVDLPAGPDYTWAPQYFTGLDENGQPQFSPRETEAAAVDLDSSTPGVQATELHDVVNQISVAWVAELNKWITTLPLEPYLPHCGVLELFAGADCAQVVIGNGAFRMRTADQPWGPWSPPQDILAAGDPAGPAVGQYGVGGMLRHPACTEPACAPHTPAREASATEYGFFYSANIIEQWTRPADDGVDIIWNASTWDPYRIILLRTHIKR
jgi:hypothetical protein